MMTHDELLDEVDPIAARVAQRVATDFAGYVEAHDIHQDMIAWALEHVEEIDGWYEADDEGVVSSDAVKRARGMIYTTCRRQARATAHRVKAARHGYSVNDLHFYSKAALEETLPKILDYEEWLPGTMDGELRSKADPAVGGNQLAVLCDVKHAFEQGSADDQLIITGRYIDALTVEEMAEQYGVVPRSMQRRIDRALRRLWQRLGDSRPDFGEHDGRRVLTNETARYVTGHQFDPDLPAGLRRLTHA